MTQMTIAHRTSFFDLLKMDPDQQARALCATETPGAVPELIGAGQIIQITAESAGTWIACELARGTAEGGKILGKFAIKEPAGVVYLQAGMSHTDLVQRITKLATAKAIENMRIISPEICGHTLPNVLNEVEQFELFNNWPKECRVLILDGLGPFLSPRVDGKKVLSLVQVCRQLSISLISVNSKGEGGIPIPWGQVDTILKVRSMDEFKPRLVLQVGFEKARNLPMGKTDTFHLELIEEENGALRFEETAVEGYQQARFLQLSANSRKQKEIAKELGVHQSTVSRWQDEALNESLIAKDDRGKTILTEAGRRVLAKWGLSNKI